MARVGKCIVCEARRILKGDYCKRCRSKNHKER